MVRRVIAWLSTRTVVAASVQAAGLLLICAGVALALSAAVALIVGGLGVVLFGVAYEKGD